MREAMADNEYDYGRHEEDVDLGGLVFVTFDDEKRNNTVVFDSDRSSVDEEEEEQEQEEDMIDEEDLELFRNGLTRPDLEHRYRRNQAYAGLCSYDEDEGRTNDVVANVVGSLDEDYDDDDDDDDDNLEMMMMLEKTTAWLSDSVLLESNDDRNKNNKNINSSARRRNDNNNYYNNKTREKDTFAWDSFQIKDSFLLLVAPKGEDCEELLAFDTLYERAFIESGVKDLDFKESANEKTICASESNLVTTCVNALMGETSSMRLLKMIVETHMTTMTNRNFAFSVRLRGASVGATKNVLSQFNETSAQRRRLHKFAEKKSRDRNNIDPIMIAFQKCLLRILEAMDASLSTLADVCFERRREGGDEEDLGSNNKYNEGGDVTLLEFAFHTRDIRKQIEALDALVQKIKQRMSSQNGVRHLRRKYGSTALDILAREIQDLHYNDFDSNERVKNLFEILFISTVKPALVQGITRPCLSATTINSFDGFDALSVYSSEACEILLQNKSDAIRKLRSIKTSVKDIRREEKLSIFRSAMKSCESILFHSSSSDKVTSVGDDSFSSSIYEDSVVQFFTNGFAGLAPKNTFRGATHVLDDAIILTEDLRAKEKMAIAAELRTSVQKAKEEYEKTMRDFENERSEIRREKMATKKELGDARRLEIFERAEKKKESKVNELTEDLERLGTFSGSAVKKRVQLLESQMNRINDYNNNNNDYNNDKIDEVALASAAEDDDVEQIEIEEEEVEEKIEKEVEFKHDSTTTTTLNHNSDEATTKELEEENDALRLQISDTARIYTRSIVDITARNLQAFIDFIHAKVSRVHISFLLLDNNVLTHVNYIAEIMFGLTGDVLETLCARDLEKDVALERDVSIIAFSKLDMNAALERASIPDAFQERFSIVKAKNTTKSTIACISYRLPEQLKRSNLFGMDFKEKFEAISTFILRLKSARATLRNLREIANTIDRTSYKMYTLEEHANEISRRRLRSFQEQLFELEHFVTFTEQTCGANIQFATDVLNKSLSRTDIDANDAKSIISKWIDACLVASHCSRSNTKTHKIISRAMENLTLFARQTYSAYNDSEPVRMLDNPIYVSTIKGLRGEFLGGVIQEFVHANKEDESFPSAFDPNAYYAAAGVLS